MQQLAGGSVDVSTSSAADTLRAIDQGAPIAILRTEMIAAPYEVMAAPSVRSFADLRGKLVMIGGAKDITRYYFEGLASAAGVEPSAFDYVYAGATASRFAALQAGSVQAGILTAPFNFMAARAGFTGLGVTRTTQIPFGFFSVNTAWAGRNLALTRRFAALFAEGVRLFYDPANRTEAVAVLQKVAKLSAEDAAATYDFYVSLHAYDELGAIRAADMQRIADFLKQSGDLAGPAVGARFVDPVFSIQP